MSEIGTVTRGRSRIQRKGSIQKPIRDRPDEKRFMMVTPHLRRFDDTPPGALGGAGRRAERLIVVDCSGLGRFES
jgi:hypothetical protein